VSNKTPLGERITARYLDYDVVTCDEAVRAKGISLSEELKTLVLNTSKGLISVSIRGNDRLSLRKIKNDYNVPQAYITDLNELKKLGLVPGTVTPANKELWFLPMFVDIKVFENVTVSTNNGTLNGYVNFDPKLLEEAPKFRKGDYCI